MAQSQLTNTCCNPFEQCNHSSTKRNLRPVARWICERTPSISMGSKICDDCRKNLANVHTTISSDSESGSEAYVDVSESLVSLNQCLSEIGETPVSKRKLKQTKYSKQKIDKIITAMKRAMISDVQPDETDDEGEIIKQLKERFHSATNMSEKVQLFYQKVGQSERFRLSLVNLTIWPEKILFAASTKLMMPGRKDFVSVKQDERRVHVQKRLILSNLREVYQSFKVKFPTEKVGFSKFAELRPKHCILAGASGTHSVCVCTIHQNVKLMMLGGKLPDLTEHSDIPTTYHNCLARIICNPPLPGCYLSTCNSCPGITRLRDDLMAVMDDSMIDNVVFKSSGSLLIDLHLKQSVRQLMTFWKYSVRN